MIEGLNRMSRWKWVGLGVGIGVFLAIAFIPSGLHRIPGAGHRPAYAAATAALMAVWWLSEALPIHWTALIPLALYPLLNVFGGTFGRNVGKSAEPFVDGYIFLFLGGMMIGASMEQWNLHRRVALHIMKVVGTDPKRLLLGVLVATATISLWISNTATAVMMMPIALALLSQLEAAQGGRRLEGFGCAVMLAVAYASNVGGIGTKIGSGTNSIFCGFAKRLLDYDIGFLQYIAMAFPFVVIFIPIVWAVLWRVARRDVVESSQGREILERELSGMGPMSAGEKKVASVFGLAAMLWIAGDFLVPVLAPHVPKPWEGFKFLSKHYEASVAMAAGVSLLLLRALSWASIKRLPFSVLILLGGSFAMAAGIGESRLSDWMAGHLRSVAALPLFAQLALTSFATVALSAVASNTGTVNVLLGIVPRSMPVFAVAGMAASCDFMLPAGTPPNAIVCGSGYVRLPVMMRVGFVLDLLAASILSVYTYVYARFLF